MEQVVELFALACIEPSNYGRAISHWTERELADEMVKQCIESISHVMGRRLPRGATQTTPDPLLTPRTKNLTPKVSDITQLYMSVN